MHEYPKMLYIGGDPAGAYVIAKNEGEERQAREAGHLVVGEDPAKAQREEQARIEAAMREAEEAKRQAEAEAAASRAEAAAREAKAANDAAEKAAAAEAKPADTPAKPGKPSSAGKAAKATK